MKIKLFFLWRDMWIGAYWDNQKRILYICPVPMIGIKIQLSTKPKSELRIYRIVSRDKHYTYAEDKKGNPLVYPTTQYSSDE